MTKMNTANTFRLYSELEDTSAEASNASENGDASDEEQQDKQRLLEHVNLFRELHGKHLAEYCSDGVDNDTSREAMYLTELHGKIMKLEGATQVMPQLVVKRESVDNFAYLAVAVLGKSMLECCNKVDEATVVTSITLAFMAITTTFREHALLLQYGTVYKQTVNCRIFNIRNRLLCDWFNKCGIWSLVDSTVPLENQYDKISAIVAFFNEFSEEKTLRHDVYLMKTTNLSNHRIDSIGLYIPRHYIILTNKYCFHLMNVGIFSGEFQRLKAHIFSSVVHFEHTGRTKIDVVEIEQICKMLALQSHSLLFNNCQNYATNVYRAICDEKLSSVDVEFSSFSGTSAIIKFLLFIVLFLVSSLVVVVRLYTTP